VTARDAFLFAGGLSTRMGRDKAALPAGGAFDGTTFLEAIARAVAPLAVATTVVGRPGSCFGYRAIVDLRPGLGPLGGIETALAHAQTASVFLLACDLPRVSTELLALVASRADASPETIVVPADASGRIAPLAGVYPASARREVARLLDAGERRPRALFERFPTVVVPFEDYRHLPDAESLLANVNTPDEYARHLASRRDD
jgi:molybdopterin-guanine dinucleotide biosynthesis protein A